MAHFEHQRDRDPRAPRTSRSQPRGTHHRAHPSACASRVPKIAAWLPPGGAQPPYLRPGGRQQPENRMHEIAGFRAPTAAPLARIDAGACHMIWGVEGRGLVRVETQKSSRATVSQAAHEQRDRCYERTAGGGALRCVLGAREPAESTACRMRIMPICVLYVGVAWSTYTAVPHHDMSVCANADPCHQRVGAASSAQSGCATHHLTSLPNCPLPSNCWHRSI